MDPVPPDAFLTAYPDAMRDIAERLRTIVMRAIPEAVERVRPGWHLIGYDVPVGPRRAVYFGYIAPEPAHVHLGFEYGVAMVDPEGLLLGAGVTRQVRWVTLREGDPIQEARLGGLVREAARVAILSRGERLAMTLDREIAPDDQPG
jgi:hypothetical protein